MSDDNGSAPVDNATTVFAVYGVEPEIQAYGMARYSRSALSMKQSLQEISDQKAEKFLNTFYFQYGHRSIADLAHLALAIERLSILAAIAVVDEQRWDGQERSTRYQDFRKSGYYVPDFSGPLQAARLYRETMDFLFAEYEALSADMYRYLAERTPRPPEMKPEAYERTLRARAFDVARYLLPLATNTSLGQIVNARTLETQIARLLSHPQPEVRRLGELMKRAAREPAYNASQAATEKLVADIAAADAELGERARRKLLREVRVAPTLVKYAEPSPYQIETRRELSRAAAELMRGAPIDPAPPVDLLEDESLEVELPTTLLYAQSHYSYRQLRKHVEALSAAQRQEIVALGTRHRGAHDELVREFSAGQKFRFDILMDVGGYRDLHRHRRCVQIGQDFAAGRHGYETPQEVDASGWRPRYDAVLQRALGAEQALAALLEDSTPQLAHYLEPLAARKRTLFKMDLAEAIYIAELRTGPGGHYSYRSIAYQMYEAVARHYPSLARYFRVTDIHQPLDLLKR